MQLRTLALIWAGLALLLSLAAFRYLEGEHAETVAEVERALSFHADAYKRSIQGWLEEREGDIAVLSANPALANYLYRLERSEAGPDSPQAARARSILTASANAYDFHGAYLLDLAGDAVLASVGAEPPDTLLSAASRHALSEGEVVRMGPGERVGDHDLVYAGPVRGETPGGRIRPDEGGVLGVVAVKADPLGQPMAVLPTQVIGFDTGELVLTRQEEGGVRYLTPLRFREGTPRGVLLTDPWSDLAARNALDGEKGFGRYTDYRGTAVFAATRGVEATGWGLVIKADRSEVLAAHREERGVVFFALFALLAAVGAAFYALWSGGQRAHAEALARRDRRFRELFDLNPLPMWIYDLRTLRFLEVNRAAVERYGWTREQFLEMTIRQIRPEEELEHFDEHLRHRRVRDRSQEEGVHRTRQGEEVLAELTTTRVEFEGQDAVMVVARDVTEERRLQERLREAQKMEAVGRLAGGIAHDFNNLLTAILGYGEMASSRLESEKARQQIEQVLDAARRAERLTSQLLAFSRKQILQPRILNLSRLVGEMDRMLRRLIGEDIELATVIDPDLECVSADPGQVEQVIMNLAVNARDAMPEGGELTIEVRNTELDAAYAASHEEVGPGPYVLLAVSDTGVGMDAETASQAFEPFFTTKEKGKGTGLGLATVYGIAKQSGGHAAIYSEVGEGTTVRFYLPRIPCGEVEYHPPVREDAAPTGGETILVAEDDDLVRRLAVSVLEGLGYTVVEAGNGLEALDRVREGGLRPHLLLTDVVMPEMSGKDLTKILMEEVPSLRVLYMSGYTDNAIIHHGVLEEDIDFIEKPFTPVILARRVREALDRG
ncbi:MAG: ATP-binding protein [bacterium]